MDRFSGAPGPAGIANRDAAIGIRDKMEGQIPFKGE
jgi:hypothetical protein